MNDYTALFRYVEENGKLTRLPGKKIQGIDLDVVEMARPDGSKLRFYISPKSYKILHVEYDVMLAEGQNPVTFRESYSDWRINQQAVVPGLLPGRRRLRQNDQVVQTMDINNGVYGRTCEDALFLQL